MGLMEGCVFSQVFRIVLLLGNWQLHYTQLTEKILIQNQIQCWIPEFPVPEGLNFISQLFLTSGLLELFLR